MDFVNKLKSIIDTTFNVSVTENMALGYKTTGKSLLDMNFAVASLRGKPEEKIVNMFTKAYFEDKQTALIWLFYARDVRGGLGERRLFRVILDDLAKNHEEAPVDRLIDFIPEYGRCDDMLPLLSTRHADRVIELIKNQIDVDIAAMEKQESVSLLAKWLPSVNASCAETKRKAKLIAQKLGLTEKEYRKTLSRLRRYLDVLECKMSAGLFWDIDYKAVPSRANIIYRKAFLRRDEERRNAFLESLKKGETTINASVLYPHEIVNAYMDGCQVRPYDETLEQLWLALPDIPALDNTIVVADGSGSMTASIGGSGCMALSVANALAVYFAEKNTGGFHNRYITFSGNPRLVDLSNGGTLKEKLQIALAYNEVANTNIYAVFDLILRTAVENRMSQDDMPKNIVVISDMEFDSCAENADEKLFAKISREYAEKNYRLPRLIFWNVNSRTNTIPVKENELGVALVSGFSISIAKMVMSLELDPYKCLLDILNDERYDKVREAVRDIKAA